jgi:tetratricopeptide (TPR) repeat protein
VKICSSAKQYLGHHENSKCTTFDIVRGFLLQLVEAKIETPALFERLLDIHKKSVQEHAIPDSEEDLWLVFRLVAATIKDLVMVIDGLDELSDVHSGPILLFEQLVKVADTARRGENTFKVVLTTRPPYGATSAHTRQYHIEQSDTATDVATTVADNINLLEEFQGLDPKVRSDISAKVIHGADGMFLWANLIVQELRNRQSDEDIETMVKSAPKDLDELYDRMLSSLDLKSEDTRRIFSWLLVAARPLHMDELAIVLTTEPGREVTKKRKSDIAEDVRKACGPLTKIDGGFVKFVHVSLKQYMEGKPFQDKYSWNASTCHDEVAFRSLAYLSFPIEGNFHSDSPGVQLTVDEITKQRFDKMVEDRKLLKYTLQYWAHHLLKSSPNGTLQGTFLKEECKDFPTHQAMAWAENILWPSTFTRKSRVQVYKIALEIREVLLDHTEFEVIQTRVGLAKALEEFGDNERASSELRNCWEACVELEGEGIETALECAKRLVLNLELRGLREKAGEMYTWIRNALSELHGPDDPLTISASRELAWFYQKYGQDQDCIDVYRGIWEVCINAFGPVDPQSIAAGTTLARTYQITKQKNESLKVYQAIWNSVREECVPPDPAYLTAAIDLFQALENCSKQEDADSFLGSVLEQCEKASPGSAMQALFVDLKLELARHYRRQGNMTESTSVILELNELCCEALAAEDVAVSSMTSIETVVAEMRQPGIKCAARLPGLLYKFLLMKHGPPDIVTVEAARQLALSLEHDSLDERARETLNDCAKKCTATGLVDIATIQAYNNLGLYDQKRNSWKEAAATWEVLLQSLWPQFLAVAEPAPPESFATEALDVAQRLGLSLEKAGQVTDAKKTYEKLFAICKKHFGIGDVKITFAADRLADILQQEGSTTAAVELYKGVYESRREAFGVSSASAVESGLRLAQFYAKVSEISKAESLYVEMLNSLERDWGKSFITAVEVSLELASVYESQSLMVYKAEKLYAGLWSLCLREKLMNTNPGNDKWKFNPSTVINLRNKLYKLYGTQRASVKFCRVAREYRQMCLESYGDGHREHIIATLRNGEILDKWRKSNEAEKIYTELLETCNRQSGPYEEADVEIRMIIGTSWERRGRAKDAMSLYEKMFEDDVSNNISSMPELMTEIALRLIQGYKKEKAGSNRSEAVFSRIIDDALSISDHNHRSTRLKSVFQFYKTLVEGKLVEAREDVLEAIWSSLKSNMGLSKDDYIWLMQRLPRLKFAEDIRNAALDQPSTQTPTKGQLDALEGLSKSHSSQCMVELWEKWHMVCATGEITRKLASSTAASFSYSDKAGLVEAARILQQTWDDCIQAFGETDVITLDAGAQAAQIYRDKDTTDLWKRMYDACCRDSDLGPYHERSVAVGLDLGHAYCKWGPITRAAGLSKDLDKGMRDRPGGIASESDIAQYVKVAGLSSSVARAAQDSAQHNSCAETAIAHTEEVLRFALDRTKTVLGPEHKLMFEILRDLFYALMFQDRVHDMEQPLHDVWEARNSKTAWASDDISRVGDHLAQIYFESGRCFEAVRIMRQLCQHDEALHGLTAQRTLNRYNRLSSCYSAQNDFAQSLAIHRRALISFGVLAVDLGNFDEPPHMQPRRSQPTYLHGDGSRSSFGQEDNDGDNRVSFSTYRPPRARSITLRGWPNGDMLKQCNLYGRALQRLGRWEEAERVYQDLWDECRRASAGGQSWMIHKFSNVKAWNEEAKARKVGEEGLWQRQNYFR